MEQQPPPPVPPARLVQPQALPRLPPTQRERPWTPERILYAWCRRRADRILHAAASPAVRDIPAELWGIVAEFLAWDDGIYTLPALNRVSRGIHEATLPVLYETVWLSSEEAFTWCIGDKNLQGFKHTKFLFVNDLTLPLLRMHQRYQAILAHTRPTSDFSDTFPRLVFLGHTKADPTGHAFPRTHPRARSSPVNVTLYKSLGLDTLTRVCTPALLGRDVATSFFGGYWYPGPYHDRPEIISVRDIVGLTIKPGAGLRPSKQVKMNQVKPTREAPCFVFKVADGTDDESLRVVVAYLKAYAGSKEVIMRGRWVRVEVKCGIDVLKKLTELLGQAQPLFLSLKIRLTGITTRQEIQQYLTALADVYTTHWTHHPSLAGDEFVRILTRCPALHAHDVADRAGEGAFLGPLTDEHDGGYLATLSAGYDDPDPVDGFAGGNVDEPTHASGFTARISETLLHLGREEGEPRTLWERVYPMRHVPVPAADPEAELGMRGLQGLEGEMMLMRYENRLRQPGRVTEEVAARLRAAGHAVPPPAQERRRVVDGRGAARRVDAVRGGADAQREIALGNAAEPPAGGA